jgi:sigma-E factor negative regulatory protein RseA
MNDTTQEQLSALLDGELPRDETRFLLRRLDNDPELARRWSRYQIASAVLRNQFVSSLPNDAFVAGVMQRLDMPGVALQRQSVGGRLLRYAGGGVIAAAVAVFALVATRPAGTDVSAPIAGNAFVSTQPLAAVTAPTAPVGELHQPLTLDQVALPGFIDYAQPASYYESIVPNYAASSRNPAGQLVNGNGAEGFVPYVLVVGARPATAQPAPRGEAAPTQH